MTDTLPEAASGGDDDRHRQPRTYKDIGYEVKDGVCTITLQRHDKKRNALSQDLITELNDAFKRAGAASVGEGEGQVSVIVLRSAQKEYFCGGIDIYQMQAAMHEPPGRREEVNLQQCTALSDLFQTMDHCPKTIIGATHGMAVGGGVTLLALCDCVIADEHAAFSYPEKAFKMLPWVSVPYLMRRVLETHQEDGYSAARQYLNGGIVRRKTEYDWKALASQDWGVVDEICPTQGKVSFDEMVDMAVDSARSRALAGQPYKKIYTTPPPYEEPVSVETGMGTRKPTPLLASLYDPLSLEQHVTIGEPRDEAVEKMIKFVTAHLRGESGLTTQAFKEQCTQNWAAQRCSDEVREAMDGYIKKLEEARKSRRAAEGSAAPVLPEGPDDVTSAKPPERKESLG